MKMKQFFSVSLIFMSLAFFMACEGDDTAVPVGEDWIQVDTKVYFIDSMTVNASTFKFDSIAVSNSSRLLVGAYTDDVFGKTKAKSYLQLAYSFESIDNEAIYDSIALILKYDNYFYNDTTQTQTINVFNILDDIKSDDDYFYNTTNFEASETAIGTKTFQPYPIKEDSLHITISDVFGKELYEKIRDNEITTSDEFLNQYKGLLVNPDDSNSSVLGFATSSFLRLYYSEDDEVEVEDSQTMEFYLNSTNSFHNVSSDYTGTYFSDLESEETQLFSTDTDDNSFVQSGTGLATRIDIPYVERINDIEGNGSVLNASLKISIKQNSSTDNLSIRDSLSVFLIDRKGDIYSTLTNAAGETTYGLLEAYDEEFKTLTYSIPVTYFLNLKLDAAYNDNLYLAIYGQDFNQSVDRYIFNGEEASSEDLKLKLELTYAIYED